MEINTNRLEKVEKILIELRSMLYSRFEEKEVNKFKKIFESRYFGNDIDEEIYYGYDLSSPGKDFSNDLKEILRTYKARKEENDNETYVVHIKELDMILKLIVRGSKILVRVCDVNVYDRYDTLVQFNYHKMCNYNNTIDYLKRLIGIVDDFMTFEVKVTDENEKDPLAISLIITVEVTHKQITESLFGYYKAPNGLKLQKEIGDFLRKINVDYTVTELHRDQRDVTYEINISPRRNL